MVTEQKRDKRGIYREFQGVKYRFWKKRGLYASQLGGKQRFLHRTLWKSVHGVIPPRHAVVPVNGDWDDFSTDNWIYQPHTYNGKQYEAIHSGQTFNGVVFRLIPETGYYGSKSTGTTELMQRYVWEYHNGPIPDGKVIHHIDHNKANNKIESFKRESMSS